MQIDAAKSRPLENVFGQDQTVGGNDRKIRAKAGQDLPFRRSLEGLGRVDDEPEIQSGGVHR